MEVFSSFIMEEKTITGEMVNGQTRLLTIKTIYTLAV